MTTIPVSATVALDTNAHEFMLKFLDAVAAIAGHGQDRSATIARVYLLLLGAIAPAEGASESAWRVLHRTIAELVATANAAPSELSAQAYLQTFLRENDDLASDESGRTPRLGSHAVG